MKTKLSSILKRIFRNSPDYSDGDLLDRIAALKLSCLSRKRINQEQAINTLSSALLERKSLIEKAKEANRKINIISIFANNKIAQHQGVKEISDTSFGKTYAIRAIPWEHVRAIALMGYKACRK